MAPGQNGKITDDDVKCSFVDENWSVLIMFSLKSDLWGVIGGKSSFVQIVACQQTDAEPMITSFSDAYMQHL